MNNTAIGNGFLLCQRPISIESWPLENRGLVLSRVASFLPKKMVEGSLKKVCKAWKEVFAQTILGDILRLSLDLRTPYLSRVVPYLTPRENALIVRVSKKWEEVARTTSTEDLYLFGLMQSYSPAFFTSFSKLPLLTIGKRTFRYLDSAGEVLGRYLEKRFSATKSNEEAFDFLTSLTQEQREYIKTLNLGKGVTDYDVASFLTLCPNVRSLTVSSSVATGAFLSSFKGGLIKLDFRGDQINEDDIKEFVKENSELINLVIISENVCGNFLEGLSDFNKLKMFYFKSNKIQESYLDQIRKMSSLESLCIISEKVSGLFLRSVPVSLKRLRLEGEMLEERFLSAGFLKCPLLELLDISSDAFQGWGLNVLSRQNRMQQIRLQGEFIEDQYLENMAKKCEFLKNVEILSKSLSCSFVLYLPGTLEYLYTETDISKLRKEKPGVLNRILQRMQNVNWNLKEQIFDELKRRKQLIEDS